MSVELVQHDNDSLCFHSYMRIHFTLNICWRRTDTRILSHFYAPGVTDTRILSQRTRRYGHTYFVAFLRTRRYGHTYFVAFLRTRRYGHTYFVVFLRTQPYRHTILWPGETRAPEWLPAITVLVWKRRFCGPDRRESRNGSLLLQF
jgi:hypothetical protein